MRLKVKSILLTLSICCLGAFFCGCSGPSSEPPAVSVDTLSSESFEKGLELGRRHQDEGLQTYRLVIALKLLPALERKAFIEGFVQAYAEAGNNVEGEKYAGILQTSVETTFVPYEQAFNEGKGHATSQITDAYIQNSIRSFGASGGRALAWKAGYIEGFAHEIMNRRPGSDKESLYRQAETMYNALKRPLRL